MIRYNLGSFPNSRIKARKATQDAITEEIELDTNPQRIREANEARTYLTIKNDDDTNSVAYGYDELELNFILGPGEGIDIESLGDIWAKALTDTATLVLDEGAG